MLTTSVLLHLAEGNLSYTWDPCSSFAPQIGQTKSGFAIVRVSSSIGALMVCKVLNAEDCHWTYESAKVRGGVQCEHQT